MFSTPVSLTFFCATVVLREHVSSLGDVPMATSNPCLLCIALHFPLSLLVCFSIELTYRMRSTLEQLLKWRRALHKTRELTADVKYIAFWQCMNRILCSSANTNHGVLNRGTVHVLSILVFSDYKGVVLATTLNFFSFPRI